MANDSVTENTVEQPPPLRPSHIRVGVVRASRRINGSRGSAGKNLCGHDVTDRDVLYREAKRIVEANLAVWPVCQECRALWLKAEAQRREVNALMGGAR